MELKGKSVLIFAGPSFEDRELFYPLYRFLEAGASVKVAGIGEKSYEGKYGVPVKVDGQAEDFAGQKWDIVVVPGGWAPDKIRMNEDALDIVRQTLEAGSTDAALWSHSEDVAGRKWDLGVVPGGWAPDKIRMNEAALDIVRKTLQAGSIVAAICH